MVGGIDYRRCGTQEHQPRRSIVIGDPGSTAHPNIKTTGAAVSAASEEGVLILRGNRWLSVETQGEINAGGCIKSQRVRVAIITATVKSGRNSGWCTADLWAGSRCRSIGLVQTIKVSRGVRGNIALARSKVIANISTARCRRGIECPICDNRGGRGRTRQPGNDCQSGCGRANAGPATPRK